MKIARHNYRLRLILASLAIVVMLIAMFLTFLNGIGIAENHLFHLLALSCLVISREHSDSIHLMENPSHLQMFYILVSTHMNDTSTI